MLSSFLIETAETPCRSAGPQDAEPWQGMGLLLVNHKGFWDPEHAFSPSLPALPATQPHINSSKEEDWVIVIEW